MRKSSINENAHSEPGTGENSVEYEYQPIGTGHQDLIDKRKATAKFSGGKERAEKAKQMHKERQQTTTTHYEEFKHPNLASMD